MKAKHPDKNLEPFIQAIQTNCDISDASGAGIFSICGMALRLRDLNKWEKDFDPWQENNPADLVGWIDKKENLWETLEGSEFLPLPLENEIYDPFDAGDINQTLSTLNLFYGAGYAHSLKPSFFLAEIEEKKYLDGIPVIILGKEFLRDLLTIPALNQDGAVLIRRHAARLFLWDQMTYLKESGKPFLNFALSSCGLPDTGIKSRKAGFSDILSAQEAAYIHHEIGEIKDLVFDRRIFRELVSQFPHTPVELLTRTIKDLLADTGPCGTLRHLISSKNAAALGFYAAFQDGLFKPLFPELRPAVEAFMSDHDWEGIETARQEGFNRSRQYAHDVMGIYEKAGKKGDPDQVEKLIHETLVRPLIEKSAP